MAKKQATPKTLANAVPVDTQQKRLDVTLKDGIVTITCPVEAIIQANGASISSSGKSYLLGTTSGFYKVPDSDISVSVNVAMGIEQYESRINALKAQASRVQGNTVTAKELFAQLSDADKDAFMKDMLESYLSK